MLTGPFSEGWITLSDLYKAYRKAKAEAFFESTHFGALAFANYERRLDHNLLRLLAKLLAPKPAWFSDRSFLGGYSYLPKSVKPATPREPFEFHFRTVDPEQDWVQLYEKTGRRRFDASFRLVAVPSVDFHIVSALWILKAGHLFDATLSSTTSFGNRIRRIGSHFTRLSDKPGPVNEESPALFEYYFFAYQKWRELGLTAMRVSLSAGVRIAAVTMDIRRFYHSVNPAFLLRGNYLRSIGIKLTADEQLLTAQLIGAIGNWYRRTPDFKQRPDGAIPVGLSASKVIANVILAEFDREVQAKLAPVYYGRYVDDIFLVFAADSEIRSGEHLMKWIAKRMAGRMKYETPEVGAPHLRLTLPYAKDSELIFAGDKQKIFLLQGQYGLDLVGQIGEQIRQKSSEHRLLPQLPERELEMAERALLATPDATLEADALRKADAVSLKRLGFSLLLRTVERYARDLQPLEWRHLRLMFYGLVLRYTMTPQGFFDYFGYIQRVFGLMVACGDFTEAKELLDDLERTIIILRETTLAGSERQREFAICINHYARGFFQSAAQASTVSRFKFSKQYLAILRRLAKIEPSLPIPRTMLQARSLAERLLLSDLGRRAYRDYWYHENPTLRRSPPVPQSFYVRRRLILVKRFRERAELRPPHWPALVFPTRPLTLPEISLIAPMMMSDTKALKEALFGLRGARVWSGAYLGFRSTSDERNTFFVPGKTRERIVVAVTNVKTTEKQGLDALCGRPDHSLRRYKRFHDLINSVLQETKRPDYIVLPECSIPLRWAISIAQSLGKHRISFLAGLEHRKVRTVVRNDALVSLATNWAGYPVNVCWLQAKLRPAYDEEKAIRKYAKANLYRPKDPDQHRPIYVHGQHCFGLLLCSDLTTISNRSHFQGQVDSLFILEWNQDVNTFSFLIESAAHDVHAYIVQVNNRLFGDSRIRAPFEADYLRDMIRVKGGISDYYVLAEMNIKDLRDYQRKRRPSKRGPFKPFPIDFKMSALRKGL